MIVVPYMRYVSMRGDPEMAVMGGGGGSQKGTVAFLSGSLTNELQRRWGRCTSTRARSRSPAQEKLLSTCVSCKNRRQ